VSSGFDFRALREQRGLKRPEVAAISGLSVGVIARIETTGKVKPAEHAALKKVFPPTQSDNEPIADAVQITPPAISADKLHKRVLEWNGMVTGDKCLVSNTYRSRWTFIAHCTSPEGSEYIAVKGGKPGHVLERAFALERVKPMPVKKRRKKKTED
jgi:hypothetical protein